MWKIQLVDHSGFCLETEKGHLIFDFYRDPKGILNMLKALPAELPVLYFVSHEHPDHWNPQILGMTGGKRTYLIEEACELPDFQEILKLSAQGATLLTVAVGDRLQHPHLKEAGLAEVRVYGSTDEGASFLLCFEGGQRLFFAGDLNDWDWQDEDSPAMEEKFRRIVTSLREDLLEEDCSVDEAGRPLLDFVFFPVDARLESTALKGALGFSEQVASRHFIPMHLSGGQKLPSRLQQVLPQTVTTLLRPGDTVML